MQSRRKWTKRAERLNSMTLDFRVKLLMNLKWPYKLLKFNKFGKVSNIRTQEILNEVAAQLTVSKPLEIA